MGISGFWSWFRENQKDAFVELPPTGAVEAEHILIDMNGLLHTAARKSNNFDQWTKKIFSLLNRMLKNFTARKTIFLALDGPASAAKLNTQRKRRWAPEETVPEGAKPPTTAGKKGQNWDSRGLTPGTPMMAQCKEALLYYCVQRLQSRQIGPDVQFILSGADSPGEGEVKLFSWMMENRSRHTPGDRYLVISEDADIILLALATGLPDVYVLHDSTDRFFFSTTEFAVELARRFPEEHIPSMQVDMVLIALLQGNDYLPKMKRATMALWDKYLQAKEKGAFPFTKGTHLLQNDFRIHWQPFLHLLAMFNPQLKSQLRPNAPKKQSNKRKRQRQPDPEEEDEEEENTAVFSGTQVSDYLNGLLWCVYMYTTGVCPDYEFHYPYGPAPSAMKIWQYFLTLSEAQQVANVLQVVPSSLPLPPLVFCLTVLPPSARHCLALPLQALVAEESPLYASLSSPTIVPPIEQIMEHVHQIPSKAWEKSQARLAKQFAPSIILTRQTGNPISHRMFEIAPPRPPVRQFSRLQRPSRVLALHFDISKRRLVPQYWTLPASHATPE